MLTRGVPIIMLSSYIRFTQNYRDFWIGANYQPPGKVYIGSAMTVVLIFGLFA